MFIIGVTGSLSTGKSTVSKYFKDLGAKVINADNIAHQVLKIPSCRNRVIKIFGKEVLRGAIIDRKKIAEVAFKNISYLKRLEKVIHPLVKKEIRSQIKVFRGLKKDGLLVVDVPLLFEAGLNKYVDRVVVVKLIEKTQLERAMKQLHISVEQARLRIKAQMPLKDKIRKADFIIDNEGSLNQTKKQVKEIWLKLQ